MQRRFCELLQHLSSLFGFSLFSLLHKFVANRQQFNFSPLKKERNQNQFLKLLCNAAQTQLAVFKKSNIFIARSLSWYILLADCERCASYDEVFSSWSEFSSLFSSFPTHTHIYRVVALIALSSNSPSFSIQALLIIVTFSTICGCVLTHANTVHAAHFVHFSFGLVCAASGRTTHVCAHCAYSITALHLLGVLCKKGMNSIIITLNFSSCCFPTCWADEFSTWFAYFLMKSLAIESRQKNGKVCKYPHFCQKCIGSAFFWVFAVYWRHIF